MRLTLINQFYTPDISPTAHLCASLAEHRAALGDSVTVLTSRTGYLRAVNDARSKRNVRVRRLWSTRFGSRSNLRRLLDWMSFYLPAIRAAVALPGQDVIIAMTTPPFIALAAWLHKLLNPRAKFVLWNMDVYPEALERTNLIPTNGIVSRIMRSANRAIFRRLDHLICLDPAMADLLLSQYSPAGRDLPATIIPNWESAELFPPPVLSDRPREKFVVLYLGNAGYGHEFQTAIEAADRLRNDPVTFLFVGGGALRPSISKQCELRKLTNVILRDYVPKEQTPALMNEAGCALIALENAMLGVMSPSKLHANLATGLPILYVGPPGSNVDEAIRRFDCGASIRPGDVESFVAFVRRMMSDSNEKAELQQHARNAFETAYCDRATLPQFDGILEKLRCE